MTMVFHICGICDRDRGRVDLVTIDEDILTRVRRSAMPRLVVQLTAAKDDIIASIGEQAYAAAADAELTVDGLVRGAIFVCKRCVGQLPKLPKATRQTAR